MAYGNTFKRLEVKYPLTAQQYAAIRKAISPYMTEDKYGKSKILNIYCDSDDNTLIRTSLDKPSYKEKLRLRCYGTPKAGAASFLEIKKKFKGVVYKRRVELPYAQALDYLQNGTPLSINNQQLDEIDYMINFYGLKPKIVICYDRRAFFGNEDKEFRLTFDSNIRSRRTDIDLRSGDYGEILQNQPFRVMEIKVAGAMPLWMVKILSDLEIRQGSFSKYGNIYAGETHAHADSKITTEMENIRECSQVS